ncbi:MAG: hypothetical protein RMK57_09210 [Bryobacterales bacterium]|nr:hypothetical protein [Bryobacteraceae bacterium]MDW8354694.1 hypothetical protein [Bryobacterales bacterium]
MSDYMFMLESHLSAEQNRVVAQVQAAAAQSRVNLFLTGGAVRDMLAGQRIRDLDFTVEGDALAVSRAVASQSDARILSQDPPRQAVELLFPGNVRASISMARREEYPRPGAQPRIAPATIHEDLRSRDFTFNAIALSLNRASLGLLLDPNNGMADLEHREIRAVHNRVFVDDPSRLLRLVRFRVRLDCTVEPKTQSQYENARLEELEKRIPPRRLFEELRDIAEEQNPARILELLDEESLLSLYSPALTGAKLNLPAIARWQKARELIPFSVELPVNHLALLLYLLTEKLTPKERAVFAKATALHKAEVQLAEKLPSESKALERQLRSPRLHKASQVYHVLSAARGEQILFLYLRSPHRIVHDRIRNYLQKYLPAAQEVTDRQVSAAGAEPGSEKFRKLREQMIAERLDGRTRKPREEQKPAGAALEPAKPAPSASGRARSTGAKRG